MWHILQGTSVVFTLLITICIFRCNLADQLDPIEELISKLNPRTGGTTTDESALKVQEKCNNDIKNVGDLDSHFPTPTPNDIRYNSSGFRKLGDKCNLEEEREFYKGLLDLVKQKTADISKLANYTNLDLSPHYRIQQWSDHWKDWQANNRSFQVCNPRWLLECGKFEGRDACVCLSKGISGLHYSIGLEIEEIKNDGCNDAGNCGGDSAPLTPPFRCVAKTLDTSAHDEDEETVSGCEISLPVFGICQLNCNLGVACTTLDPSLLNFKNKKFRNRKVCCNVVGGCLTHKQDNFGRTIKAKQSLLLIGVWGALSMWVYQSLISK